MRSSASGCVPLPRMQAALPMSPSWTAPPRTCSSRSHATRGCSSSAAAACPRSALLVGSVSHDAVRHARCAVVVVPADASAGPPGRVVVGVDESPNSTAAADWAAVEALAHGVPLVLVHSASVGLVEDDEQSVVTAASTRLAGTVGEDLKLDRIVTHEAAGAALVATAMPGDLLVVGTHARGPVARLFVGSTSTYCIEHATCPVAVVPLHP